MKKRKESHIYSNATCWFLIILLSVIVIVIYSVSNSSDKYPYDLNMFIIFISLIGMPVLLCLYITFELADLHITSDIQKAIRDVFYKTVPIYGICFTGVFALSELRYFTVMGTAYSIFLFLVLLLDTRYVSDGFIHELHKYRLEYIPFESKHPILFKSFHLIYKCVYKLSYNKSKKEIQNNCKIFLLSSLCFDDIVNNHYYINLVIRRAVHKFPSISEIRMKDQLNYWSNKNIISAKINTNVEFSYVEYYYFDKLGKGLVTYKGLKLLQELC